LRRHAPAAARRLERAQARGCRCRLLRRNGSRSLAARTIKVGLDDPAARAGTGQPCQVDALLLGQSAGKRARLDAVCATALRVAGAPGCGWLWG
jgi:hypothetical protein